MKTCRKIELEVCVCAALVAFDAPARAEKHSDVFGSTRGAVTGEPVWSAGIQFGSGSSSGLSAQRVGVAGGAATFGLGVERGDLALAADWLILANDGFQRVSAGTASGYNAQRDALLPYLGAGVLLGPSVALRVPAGVQYTMRRDPFNFFGGLTLLLGNFGRHDRLAFELWIQLGARLLL